MGDDPVIPAELMHSDAVAKTGSSAATGGNSTTYNIQSISSAEKLTLMVVSCLALGLAVGAVVMMAWGQSIMREQNAAMVEAAERRAMDRSTIAEREARVAVDQMQAARIELAKRGIVIQTDDHQ